MYLFLVYYVEYIKMIINLLIFFYFYRVDFKKFIDFNKLDIGV